MPETTWSGWCRVFGIGAKDEKYKQLLQAVCASGVKLVSITFSPRTLFEETIYFTVEGTHQEVWSFYWNCPK